MPVCFPPYAEHMLRVGSFLSSCSVFVWFQPNLLEELSQVNGLCEFPRKAYKEKRERRGKAYLDKSI